MAVDARKFGPHDKRRGTASVLIIAKGGTSPQRGFLATVSPKTLCDLHIWYGDIEPGILGGATVIRGGGHG